MAVERKLLTAAELLRRPDDGLRHELIDGELRTMSPTGGDHGEDEITIGFRLGQFLERSPVGRLFGGEVGFWIRRDPDRVRAADIAIILRDRLPAGARQPAYFEIPPDLVVEVVSPNDAAGEIDEKVQEWLRFGAKAVWVVYSGPRLWVHRPDGTAHLHGPEDEVEGGDALPGFRMPLSELLRPPGA